MFNYFNRLWIWKQHTQAHTFAITFKNKAQDRRRLWLYKSCFQVISVLCWFHCKLMAGWSPLHPRSTFSPTFAPSSSPNLSSRSQGHLFYPSLNKVILLPAAMPTLKPQHPASCTTKARWAQFPSSRRYAREKKQERRSGPRVTHKQTYRHCRTSSVRSVLKMSS